MGNQFPLSEVIARDLQRLLSDVGNAWEREGSRRAPRVWSYGDVENNGVYYHPQLTHYAHQAFEEYFFERTEMHYCDLSGTHEDNVRRRNGLPRVTFPVGYCHQLMFEPMRAGDEYCFVIDGCLLDAKRVRIRARTYLTNVKLAGVIIWVRWYRNLSTNKTEEIPRWFQEKLLKSPV